MQVAKEAEFLGCWEAARPAFQSSLEKMNVFLGTIEPSWLPDYRVNFIQRSLTLRLEWLEGILR